MEKLNELILLAEEARDLRISMDRVDPEDIVAIAEAFRALEHRAEAAEAALEEEKRINSKLREDRAGLARECNAFEAKLAELEKQEPIGYHSEDARSVFRVWPHADGKICVPVYARPAPAINLAELVPDAVGIHDMDPDSKDVEVVTAIAQCEGWNACRAEMLRNIDNLK